jgi:hypothetical protein
MQALVGFRAYGETLACCPHAVYPLDFLDDGIPVDYCVPLALVSTYQHRKQRFRHAYHNIPLGGTDARVRTSK